MANDYSVVKERRPLETHAPSPADVLVIINGSLLTDEDRTVINEFLSAGGRLVAVGTTWLAGITDQPPTGLNPTDATSQGVLPLAGFDAVERVSPGPVWEEAGSLVPVIGNDDGVAVGIEYVGAGTVVAIADDRVISNRLLDRNDHALVAFLAIGEPEGTVRFVEYIHGFTQPTGLAALPTRWKQALLVITVAGFIWLVARGHRFSPPEDSSRGLAPPRSAYVDALATTLEASKDPQATAALDSAIEAELVRRGADLGSSPSRHELAARAGVPEETVQLALSPGSSDQEARAKATLLAHLVNKEQL
jgi:hypothetical protein